MSVMCCIFETAMNILEQVRYAYMSFFPFPLLFFFFWIGIRKYIKGVWDGDFHNLVTQSISTSISCFLARLVTDAYSIAIVVGSPQSKIHSVARHFQSIQSSASSHQIVVEAS